ncbi:MAG: hypothetical protein CMD18_01515 [Flavobacteriales bacterium]|nr:hypothetical protein [Flavobacteriales bacterium]
MNKIYTFFACLFSLGSFAQLENFYVFGGLGSAYYQGDLNSKVFPSAKVLNFSLKGGVGYHLNEKFGVLAHFAKSSLNASDLDVKNNAVKVARGISFKSPLTEIGLNFKIRSVLSLDEKYINYILLGANYFEFNPTLLQEADPAYIPSPLENGYQTSGVNVPLGFGFGMWLKGNLRIVWETAVHLTYTDYIDGVSQNGNPVYKDAFVDSHVMLLYSFTEPLAQKDKYQKKYK